MKLHAFMNGEPWALEENTIVRHRCCDCGLVHAVHVDKARKGRVVIRFYRDDWSTRKLKKKGTKGE